MVSPPKQHSRVASQQQANKCKLIKGSRPLVNYKFYLDIENHQISSKIETKIKELGGSVEFFLAKEVTHFVTDKISTNCLTASSPKLHTPTTPKTPLTPFLSHRSESANVASPNVSNSTEYRATSSAPRNRVDVMLQKARDKCETSVKSTNIPSSPVQLAKTWGTPIWSTQHTLKFLEKICIGLKSYSSHHSSKGRPANVKHLHGDYIKIESIQRNYRPYFHELKNWPKINLNATIGFSPFGIVDLPVNNILTQVNKCAQYSSSDKSKKMTRKSRSKQMRTKNDYKRTSERECGYCEVCRVEYDILSVHLQSKEHVNFVKNSDNFLSLDNLINNSANVDTFLKMNSAPPKNDYDSGVFSKRTCRRVKEIMDCEIRNDVIKSNFVRLNGSAKMVTRRSNNRKSDLNLDSKLCNKSPTKDDHKTNDIDIDSASQLRSRRESARRINYAEPREDEDTSDDLKTKIRIRGIRWRAPSPEQNFSSQPAVYKIRKGSKNLTSFSDQNKDPQSGLKVKICRVRESELSLLTNEADKFMFPPCLSDRPTDEDRQSSTDRDGHSTELSSSDVDNSKRSKLTKITQLDVNSKRRRRNQLQSFLEDNSDYYKFEKPDSRLRFPEAPVQPILKRTRTVTTSDVNSDAEYIGDLEDRTGAKRNNQNEILASDKITSLKFSFERVPSSEPWYDAFQRQDECRERVFEYWGNTAYRKLPYEIGPLPPLAPNCCFLSKLAHKKLNTNKIDRRFKCYRDQKLKMKLPENKMTETINSDSYTLPTVINKMSSDDQVSMKVSREILNLKRNEINSKSKSPVIFSSTSNGNRADSKSVANIKSNLLNNTKKSLHKRNLINEFVSNVRAESKEIKVKSAISNSRRNSLLDLNGQPRKSPREHASTLAIISCLAQERRKREKELNGGISPEKMPLKEEDNDDEQDNTSNGSFEEDSNDTDALTTTIKQEVESCDELSESNNCQLASSSTNIKLEPPNVLLVNEKQAETIEAVKSTKEDVKEDIKEEFKCPKMPNFDFVNPFMLYKQIDQLLRSSELDESNATNEVPISLDNTNDLVLIGTPKDFLEIVSSTSPGPLRYRSLVNLKKPTGLSSFSRTKKRRNNKTGWPTLPKRRILTKKEIEEDSNSCSNLSITELDEDIDDGAVIHDDRVDISEKLENGNDEYFIHSRQKLNSMGEDVSKDDEYSNDVSSDSLDTELTESNNKQHLDKDYDVISMKSLVNVSDESSADVTLAEMLKKQIGVGEKLIRCSRQRKHSKKLNNLKILQPIICVKKINESDKFMSKKNSPIKEQSNVRNNSSSTSPNTKCSPRKLRKPRGRWYRER